MRKPTIGDQVWTDEGGRPWTVIALKGNSATISQGDLQRSESVHSLKIVTLPTPDKPQAETIAAPMIPSMVAFAQHFPSQVESLDLFPQQAEILRGLLKDAEPTEEPVQKLPNGSQVRISTNDGKTEFVGRHDGKVGVVLAYDPRSDSYAVRVDGVSYTLIMGAEHLVATR